MYHAWQDVLDLFHYGIYLITIETEGRYNGMIASWLTQCSHEPPLVAMALRQNRLSHTQLLTSRAFCINVLPQQAKDLIPRFKNPIWQEKFSGVGHFLSPGGFPVLKPALAYLECTLDSTVACGDHTLFIARIRDAMKLCAGTALTSADYGGVYRGNA